MAPRILLPFTVLRTENINQFHVLINFQAISSKKIIALLNCRNSENLQRRLQTPAEYHSGEFIKSMKKLQLPR